MKCLLALANLGAAFACNAGAARPADLAFAWLIAGATWLGIIGAGMVADGLTGKDGE